MDEAGCCLIRLLIANMTHFRFWGLKLLIFFSFSRSTTLKSVTFQTASGGFLLRAQTRFVLFVESNFRLTLRSRSR